MSRADRWWRSLWPAALAIDGRERVRVMVGATLGVLLTALLSHWLGGSLAASAGSWLVAPLGATAVLVFAVPASPMAQPWAVLAGNALSALVGVACARWIGPPELAAALAVGGAIAVMFASRCLHPPGGACALLVALSGIGDPGFVLFPVLANSLLLLLLGLAYHRLTRPAPATPSAVPANAPGDVDADLDAVLARYNQVLDISRDDLKALLEDTQLRAYQRVLANIRCRDIMSRDVITVNHATPLSAAWALYRQHRIKALPVVDAAGAIVGIVTPTDFMRAAGLDGEDPFGNARRAAGQAGTPVPERVGEIMSRKVRVAGAERRLLELIPLFGSTGHHHIPIVEAQGRVVGMVTQSDVVAAMCAAGDAPLPRP